MGQGGGNYLKKWDFCGFFAYGFRTNEKFH